MLVGLGGVCVHLFPHFLLRRHPVMSRFPASAWCLFFSSCLSPPFSFPLSISILLLLWFSLNLPNFQCFCCFPSHLPLSLSHSCTFWHLSMSLLLSLLSPYLGWVLWILVLMKDRQNRDREGGKERTKQENTAKGNMQKEWGKQQDQAWINLTKNDETWREYVNRILFAVLTKFILFGEGNRKTNEYLNWSLSALHPNQPRDLFHGTWTKMLSAESSDNQPVGTSANMEMSVWVRENLCMGFSLACKHLCRIRGHGSDRYLVLAVVVGKMLAAQAYKQSELSWLKTRLRSRRYVVGRVSLRWSTALRKVLWQVSGRDAKKLPALDVETQTCVFWWCLKCISNTVTFWVCSYVPACAYGHVSSRPIGIIFLDNIPWKMSSAEAHKPTVCKRFRLLENSDLGTLSFWCSLVSCWFCGFIWFARTQMHAWEGLKACTGAWVSWPSVC